MVVSGYLPLATNFMIRPKRNYGVPKYKLITELYHEQGDECPLCFRSMLPEIQKWICYKEKQKYKGVRLKRKDINLNVDHIIPVAKGGTDARDNLALTHKRCNDIKGSVQVYSVKPKRGI